MSPGNVAAAQAAAQAAALAGLGGMMPASARAGRHRAPPPPEQRVARPLLALRALRRLDALGLELLQLVAHKQVEGCRGVGRRQMQAAIEEGWTGGAAECSRCRMWASPGRPPAARPHAGAAGAAAAAVQGGPSPEGGRFLRLFFSPLLAALPSALSSRALQWGAGRGAAAGGARVSSGAGKWAGWRRRGGAQPPDQWGRHNHSAAAPCYALPCAPPPSLPLPPPPTHGPHLKMECGSSPLVL